MRNTRGFAVVNAWAGGGGRKLQLCATDLVAGADVWVSQRLFTDGQRSRSISHVLASKHTHTYTGINADTDTQPRKRLWVTQKKIGERDSDNEVASAIWHKAEQCSSNL